MAGDVRRRVPQGTLMPGTPRAGFHGVTAGRELTAPPARQGTRSSTPAGVTHTLARLAHAHPVAARTSEGLLEPGQGRSITGRRGCARAILLAQNATDRITRQLQKTADLAQALALRPENLYAVANLDRDHVRYTA